MNAETGDQAVPKTRDEEIARRLYAEHHAPISGATLRSWGKQLGIADPGEPQPAPDPNRDTKPETKAS